MTARAVVAVGVLVFLMLGLGAIPAQYEQSVTESQPLTDIENETTSIDAGNITTLSDSLLDVFYNSTVTVTANGTTYQASGNYTWHANNGTILVKQGSDLANQSQMNVSYQYHAPSNEQAIIKEIGATPLQLGDIIAIAMAAMLILLALALAGRR